MITIQNTLNSAIVYSDSIDPAAEGLIRALCGSPLSKGSQIRIMPDVHPGKGCAIGTTMTLTDKVAPGLVGTDIGCGMTVWKVSGKRMELQKLDIQAVYPFEEPVALICNDESKSLGLPWNRMLRHSSGEIYDIIAGTFFLCAAPKDSESFEGLTENQVQAYTKRLAHPEYFLRTSQGHMVLEL